MSTNTEERLEFKLLESNNCFGNSIDSEFLARLMKFRVKFVFLDAIPLTILNCWSEEGLVLRLETPFLLA